MAVKSKSSERSGFMSISINPSMQLNASYRPQDKSDSNYVCQTCKQRRYKDGSNDPGVSFKTPGYISPGSSAAVVAGHEQEHVAHAKAKAGAEDRRVVSQSVVLHYAVCPECHRSYVSGGTTKTVTVTDNTKSGEGQANNKSSGNLLDIRV
jgi:hypothetical protein